MFSDPVVGESFFGRQAILEILVKRTDALQSGYRQNVAIIGHQQLGKTSILRQFLHVYQNPQILAIYVEIKIQSLDYFVDQFTRSLLYQFLVLKGSTNPFESVRILIEKAAPFLPKTTKRIDEIRQLLRQRHAEEAYSELFELTSIVREETGKNCIVILDEFHRLGEFGVKNAFSDFGKRIMVQKDTMYLLASSSFSASRKILAEKLALLFGNFERIYLEPFDFETSFDFLDKKLSPITVPKILKHFLVAFTDGHPFFLDAIATRVRELSSASGQSEVSEENVAEVLLKLLFESQGILNQFFMKLISPWLRPDSRGDHLLILTALAKGANKLKEISGAINRNQRETSRQIQDLMQQELIIKTGVFYRFHNKIFKFWLAEVYEKKELSLLGVYDKAGDFRQRIREIIEEYGELARMDFSERILKLFRLFNNEIVEFGEKKRRLPHFTEMIQPGEESDSLRGSSRQLVARGHGRCWICQIVEEKATESQVQELVRASGQNKKEAPTKVLVALNGLDDNAKLLAKEKRILTLGLSRINLLMDVYGDPPIVHAPSSTYQDQDL